MDAQQENNGFGRIPQRRGESAKAFAKVLVFVLAIPCVIAVFIAQDKEVIKDYVFLFPLYLSGRLLLSFLIGKVMQKICLLWEESRHRQTRYNGSWMKVLNSTFGFSSGDAVFFAVTLLLLPLSYALRLECATFTHVDYQFWLLCATSCWVALLSFAAGCREPSLAEVSRINERENKNVADGLAWGYYLAYLKIVLPKLDQRIDNSEEYREKIKSKKLYILIPKDCYTFQKINDADSRVTAAGDLEPYVIYRAGTKRVYNNTVQRIQYTGEACYLVLEYATTLTTLYEMRSATEAGMSREQKEEQVVLFYRKLKEILDENPECRNKYELVPFSGEHNQIADVLKKKISEVDVTIRA
ncbi:stimulator of interferon genes protein-like [Acropora millepora]|uniref:stimulator of interferon genes protein-like n=1 Tax=Acropora millepora TaxID=45264 RepID=UPI001CF21381|nr:stimulator of interferon genes protein-like [Acropora millepora]